MVHILLSSSRRSRLRARQGFTLIEILIVGALIAIFSGLAIVNMQHFFDDSQHKMMYGEAKQISTALSFAQHDLGFYPRLVMLAYPTTLVTFNQANQTFLRPGFDTYGYYAAFGAQVTNVLANWHGPYYGMGNEHRVVKMRLTDAALQSFPPNDPAGQSFSEVLWPADRWGNPWMVYQVVSDPAVVTANNPYGMRLINSPSEQANYFSSVVSYGQNLYPGGNDQTAATDPNYIANVLTPSMLYVKGDVTGGDADFSLKSFTSTNASTLINPVTFNPLLAQSIKTLSGNLNDGGIQDSNVDDVSISF